MPHHGQGGGHIHVHQRNVDDGTAIIRGDAPILEEHSSEMQTGVYVILEASAPRLAAHKNPRSAIFCNHDDHHNRHRILPSAFDYYTAPTQSYRLRPPLRVRPTRERTCGLFWLSWRSTAANEKAGLQTTSLRSLAFVADARRRSWNPSPPASSLILVHAVRHYRHTEEGLW